MDFNFSEYQKDLRQKIREFSETKIFPQINEMETTGNPPLGLLKEMADMGLVGMLVPKDYGGSGQGYISRSIVIEEIARVSPATAMTLLVSQLGIAPIVLSGSSEQKRRFLPSLASGKRFSTFAGTEESGGCDFVNSQTEAVVEKQFYQLRGKKVFISNSHLADIAVVTAKVVGRNNNDLTAFIVNKGILGFKPGAEDQRFGLRGCNTGEIILENCPVPFENRLGLEGEGVEISLKACVRTGRSGIAFVGLGIMNGCIEIACKYARERILFGKPIGELEGIQWPIAEMWAEREACRWLCYRAAWLLENSQSYEAEVAAAKFMTTESAVRAAKRTLDIFGAIGYQQNHPAQRYFRDAECLIAPGATSEIMRLTIAGQAIKSD